MGKLLYVCHCVIDYVECKVMATDHGHGWTWSTHLKYSTKYCQWDVVQVYHTKQ